MAGSPLIQMNELQKRFPGGPGFGPITLELEAGIHGLLGPNGAGKTTLLKTLIGFLTPTSGTAHVLGMNVRTDSLAIRRRVGYMAENDVFVPGLNAAQTVRLAAELCGLSPARAHESASEALHAVAMGDERFHAPNRLSTGQRQKMKLASALVHAPSVLYLDEPTNGLDAVSRRAMLRLIGEIAEEKQISVILSTHILPDVQAVCHDAIVMRDGLLASVEPVNRVTLHKKATWYNVETLSDAQALRKVLSAKYEVKDDRGRLLVSAPSPQAVMAAASAANLVLTRVLPHATSTEDAILASMEGSA